MSILTKKHFNDEDAAFRYLEVTLWPNGPTCAHCGNADASRITRFEGQAHRRGVHKCNECRKQFTVKVGTVFEHGRMPLHKMLQAVYLLACSKKGISAHQLHRILEVQYKSAWFLAHRIREAMRTGSLTPVGGMGDIVEIDETYITKLEGHAKGKGGAHKNIVMSLVHRGGEVRTFQIGGLASGDLLPSFVPIFGASRSSLLTKAHGTSPSVPSSGATARSTTAATNTCAGSSRPIRLRAISRSSSAA